MTNDAQGPVDAGANHQCGHIHRILGAVASFFDRLWSRLRLRFDGIARHLPRVATLLPLFMAYVGFGMLTAINQTLSRMHLPGEYSAGPTDIASPTVLSSKHNLIEAANQWHQWVAVYGGAVPVSSIPSMLVAYVVIDLLLIALPVTVLLWKLAAYTLSRLRGDGRIAALAEGDQTRSARESLAYVAALFAIVYAIGDVAEDVFLVRATSPEQVRPELFTHIGIASCMKWAFLGAAILALAIALCGRRIPSAIKAATTDRRDVWLRVLALRPQLIVAALLLVLTALPGDLGRQLDDAFMVVMDRRLLAFITLGCAVALTVLMFYTGKLSLEAYYDTAGDDKPRDEKAPKDPAKPWPLWRNVILLVVGIGLAMAGGPLNHRFHVGIALIAPGVVLAIVALLSFTSTPPRVPKTLGDPRTLKTRRTLYDDGTVKDDDGATRGVPNALAISLVPLAVLVAMAARNGIRFAITDEAGITACPYVAAAVVLVVLAFVIWKVARRAAKSGPLARALTVRTDQAPGRRPITALLAGALLIVAVGAIDPRWIGVRLGPWGVLLAFCLSILLGLAALVLLGNRIRPFGVISVAGFGRTPIIAFVMLCFVMTSAIDGNYGYHATRLAAPATHELVSLDTAYDQWRALKGGSSTEPTPLIFVASAGGGIRAAYWTALVLRCLTAGVGYQDRGPETGSQSNDDACRSVKMPMDQIFMASGISGGSLGLALTRALPYPDEWLDVLRTDFVSTAISALAFRDVPNSLLRIDVHDQDRAAALERAWEAAVPEGHGDLTRNFLDSAFTYKGTLDFPVLALNGTSVDDGCRVTVSPLDLARPVGSPSGAKDPGVEGCLSLSEKSFRSTDVREPVLAGTKDAFDNTCQDGTPVVYHDIRLSTAALLSARFPYVSPTGVLNSCADPQSRTFDLDGGLIDSSGASPLALSWPTVVNLIKTHSEGKCYVPKLILIENGYLPQTAPADPKRPLELTAPITASSAISGARTPSARQAAALAFEQSIADLPCVKAATSSAPDGSTWRMPNVVDFYPVEQPGVEAPLGWTLSSASRRSLEHQLQRDDNRCSAGIVATWMNRTSGKPDHC